MPQQKGIERRRHTRHALRHDALLVVQGSGPTACQVVNVCEQGMWLEGVAAESVIERLSRDPTLPLEIHIFLQGEDGEHHERHMARVRRIRSPGIGVKLEQSAPALVEALRSPGVRHRRLLMDPGENARLWRIFRQQIPSLLYPLLEHFVEASVRLINQALEKTAALNERNQLRDARLMLIDEREALMRRFLRAWQEQSGLFADQYGEGEASLALVDKALFEDWLELQMVASSVAARHPEILFRLNQLVSQLAQAEYHDRNNPLAPIALCQAVQYSIVRGGFEEGAKPLLNQAFEEALDTCWATAMQQLETTMKSEGLRVLGLDEMPVRWRNEPVRPRSMTVSDESPGEGSGAADTEGSKGSAPARKGTVLRLFGLQRDPNAPDNQSSTETASRAIAELHDELLAGLEQGGTSLEAVLSDAAAARPEAAAGLDKGHWDQVRLVDRIFAAMDQLERLPDSLRALLERLRLPVLQLTLSDPDFLDNPDHTARGLLNQLMQLCVADRGSTRHLNQTVSSVVERLTAEPVPDAATLQDIEQELAELVQRQKRAFLRNADRIARNHEGRQRLEQARRAIQRRINAALAGREVPMILLDLLSAGWEQSMVLALLREGAESEAVAERFEVILQVQKWLGHDGINGDRLGFERELETPPLLDFLERELASAGEPGRYQGVLRRLGAQLRDQERPDFVWLASYPLGEASESEQAEEAQAADAGRWRTRAREMTVGDWVELTDEQGESRRVRLVWVGEDAYRFVFLTPEGLHELEYGFSEVIEGFATGRMQPVDSDEVPFVDQSLYEIVQDLYREMAFRATHDPLTGCLTRHEFEKHLGRMAHQAGDGEAAGTLIMADVDQFSVINASYGTRAGDAVLRELGALLEEARAQGSDTTVGRLGSNEFAIAVRPLPMESGLDLAERLRRRVADHGFRSQGVGFGASVSVGMALFDGTSLEADALLNAAGLAVKCAGEAGGNCVRFAGEHEQARRREVLEWIPSIDRALEDGTLSLRGQRIVPLAGEGAESLEVLLGVTDDEGNPVSPQPFMEAAEESRRAARIDRWVIEQALDWMQAQPDRVAALGAVNINLSGASLNDDAFLSQLESRLRETDVPLERLCFEVTETAAIANLHYTADFMREVRRLGCRFALDDFGTGLSSYAYLKQLPVDSLKMDGVFIRDLNEELTHYAMVRSINELAHFLGLRTIAEFVEDVETLDTLREIGVDYAQGYGIARPRALDLRHP
ncbi:MAG: DUF1631 family protein [Pseudomonadota bacterium]